jgi:predicted nucleic acid-binding protein
MKVFIDANIFVDIFNPQRVLHKYSLEIYKYLLKNQFELYTSCDLITTIYYINSKKDKLNALKNIQNIIKTLKVIDFSNDEIEQTCSLMLKDSSYKDLEDTLQYILAKKVNADCIISNDENFVSKDIKVLTSKDFYEKYIQK